MPVKQYPSLRCHRCDRLLASGEPRWIASIHLMHDVDPTVQPDAWEPPEAYLARLEAIDDEEAAAMEADVYSRVTFLLCSTCKERLRSRWM